MKIHIVQGDITQFEGDAIVNAANVTLLGGGGVDGAIHRAAGPRLKEACYALPGKEIPYHGHGTCEAPSQSNALAVQRIRCPVGEARITPGFYLPARYVIHTVGPMWFDSPSCRVPHWPGEAQQEGDPRALLGDCIASCMVLAQEQEIQTIAFPAISCGVFGGSIPVFAKVAWEILTHPEFNVRVLNWSPVTDVTFILFREEEYQAFKGTWEALT